MPKKLILIVTLALLLAINLQSHAAIIEDFESGNLSFYTFVGTPYPTASITAAHDGTYGLLMDPLQTWAYRTDAPVQVSQGDMLSTWVRFTGNSSRAYFGFGASPAGTLSLVLAPNSNKFLIQENAGYLFSTVSEVSQTYTSDTWYRVVVAWGIGGNITGYLYGSDGTTLLNTVAGNSTLYTSGGIAFRGFNPYGGEAQFDTVSKSTVPLPGALLLLTPGLVGIGVLRRRFKNRSSRRGEE